MKSAKFIVIEGLEGAGKSTAIRAVEQSLGNLGISQIQKHASRAVLNWQKNYALLLRKNTQEKYYKT